MAEVERRGEYVLGTHPHPGEHLGVRPGHPARGVDQALALGVLTGGQEQLTDRRLGAVEVEVWYVVALGQTDALDRHARPRGWAVRASAGCPEARSARRRRP